MLDGTLILYTRRLYTMRLVAKRWQQVIDGTPTFWTFVLSTLPPDVSKTTITRSKNIPLSIIYPPRVRWKRNQPPLPKDFLTTVAHTRSRWSAYSGPIVPEYLETPAPLLQTIKLWDGALRQDPDIKPLELLGGFATGLRYVELSRVSIRWKLGIFSQLNSLILDRLNRDGLSASQILDFLHASPLLEHLKFKSLYTTTETIPPSPIITLPHLRSILLSECQDIVTELILQHLRAPVCIDFSLGVLLTMGSEEAICRLMNETLHPFEGIVRAIHERNGLSEMVFGGGGLEWYTPARNEIDHKFHVHLRYAGLTSSIRWVEGVLDSNSGLRIYWISNFRFIAAVLETIAPMRCATSFHIGGYQGPKETRLLLNFLAKPLSANPSLPSLPCLRELILTSWGWNAQDLLDFVHSRKNILSLDTDERPPLAIKISCRAFLRDGGPRPILDYAVLTKIRETKGVERVEFFGSKQHDGMLAVIWNEEASQPLWC